MREIRERRERHEKHFQLSDGTCQVVRTQHPIHYRHLGEWVEYAPRWSLWGSHWVLRGMDSNALADVCRPRVDHCGWSAELIEPVVETIAEPVGHRLVYRFGSWDLYLLPHYEGLDAHAILYDDSAPRRFVWRHDGPWSDAGGFDNLDGLTERVAQDHKRQLELVVEQAADTLTVEWTGRTKAVDPQRRKRFADDYAYPVRVRVS